MQSGIPRIFYFMYQYVAGRYWYDRTLWYVPVRCTSKENADEIFTASCASCI